MGVGKHCVSWRDLRRVAGIAHGLATTSEMTSRRADGPSAEMNSPMFSAPRRIVPRSSRSPFGSGAARIRIDDMRGLASAAECSNFTPAPRG